MREKLEEFLKKIGFENEEVEEILEFANNEIDCKGIYEKIDYLKNLNIDNRIIKIIIEENPLFLTSELSEIETVIEYLKEKGLEEYIVNILEVDPEIINTPVDTLRKNEKLLKMIMSEEKVKLLLRDRIEILTFNSDYLSKKLAFLIENGLKEKITYIILSNIEIFYLEDDEIDIEELKNM